RLLSQPEHGGVLGDAADAQLLGQGVEVGIAGLVNRFADTHGPVTAVSGDPTFEEAAVKSLAASASNDEILCNTFLQSGGGHDDLEHRTRSEERRVGKECR